MEPQRKLKYLQALELDVWLPHTQLPGARAGSLFKRRAKVAVAATGAPATADSPPPNPDQPRAIQSRAAKLDSSPGISAVLESLETGSHAKVPSRPAVPASQPSVETTAAVATQKPSELSSAAEHDTGALTLFLLNCPGKLLLIDSGASSRPEQHLLRNMMFALTAVKPGRYQAIPFDSRSSVASGTPTDVLHGIIDRSTAEGGAGVLLMGADAQQAFGSGAAPGQLSVLSIFGNEVAAVSSYSAEELLQNPALKAQTWAHVQALVRRH